MNNQRLKLLFASQLILQAICSNRYASFERKQQRKKDRTYDNKKQVYFLNDNPHLNEI